VADDAPGRAAGEPAGVEEGAGYSAKDLADIAELGKPAQWQDLAARKLEELAALAARVQVARTSLEHALACPHGNPRECPTFWSVVDARLQGRPLADAH
jgi:hypothetical protein